MPIDWLLAKMDQWSADPAVVWHNTVLSYGELLRRVEIWKNELGVQDVGPGTVVGLEGDYSPNVCALLLALIREKAIIVPLTEAMGMHREEFLDIAQVQQVFMFDDNDNWKTEIRENEVTNQLSKEFIGMGVAGLVLFSSGSTGKNKAALHNFEKLIEKFKLPRHRMRSINFLLFDHIGGINTLFYTLSNGGTVVTTKDRNPDNVCKLIEKYSVELLPTTPTFLNLVLLSEAYWNYDLSSLKLITYGTEVMPESVLKRVHQVLPDVRLLQTYGLSELGILRSKSRDSGSLWVKVGGEGFETKIVDGILWIRADSAMMGYLNAPSPFTHDGWFITGDAVEVDGEYVRILGRESEIINVGGEKVYPAEVESVLQTMEGVADVAVTSEPNPITGRIVKAHVKLSRDESISEFRKRMWEFCRGKLPRYKIPQKVVIVSQEMYGQRFKKMRARTSMNR
jgi:acyl-CoA synthetase (AMP-forming)/AMP-acid ligase II